MSKEDKYFVKSVVAKLKKDKSSNFLDPRELNIVTSELNKNKINYNVFYPFKESEKVIVYNLTLPEITLFEIDSKLKLEHREILGSLFGLNIEKDVFGDIIVGEKSYIMVVGHMKDYIKYNLNQVGNNRIELIERDLEVLENYKREYEEYSITSSSNRIDSVISKIIGTSRSVVTSLINNKQVILNWDVLTKHTYLLKPGDVFSVRGYGKYRYIDVSHLTKSGKLIIDYQKYK